MEQLTILLFGLPRLERAGRSLAFQRRRALALLAYLVVKKQPQSRDTLHDLIWPTFDRASAQNNLRRELSLLNSSFGEPLLATDRNRVVFEDSASVQVDVHEFLAHLTHARTLTGSPDYPSPEYITALTQAVAIYSNDFLAGFGLPDSVAFDEWQFFEAESLRRACAEALQTLIECHIHRGAYDQALVPCQQWISLDPLHEPAQRQMMQVLSWAGQQSAALRQYERFVQLLAEELGISPAEPTSTLYEAIRTRQLPPPPSPSHQYARLPGPPHNLPTPATPFIGREQELAELNRLLADPDVRLITIFAPGGMGKTRLMLEAAQRRLGHYTHGVYLVELGPLRDPDDIIPALAAALRYDPPPDERSLKQQLLDYLKTRHMLLLMDNYEHLLEGASIVDDILRAAPMVRGLVTSREKLNMSGETVLELGGMDFPDWRTPDDILAYSAGVLFNQSARRVYPAFALRDSDRRYVAQICQRTGGLPLGILLAASWVGTLSIQEIAEELQQSITFLAAELRDIPERHRSIRAAFNSSWQRLAPAERAIMIRLSVFRGGFTREAIQKVTGASLRQLATLVNTAMLQRHPDHERYSLHELLRQYAEDHLVAQGQIDEARKAHSRYYLDLMASLEMDLKGRRQAAALDQVEADLENVRAAWQYAAQQADYSGIGQALDSMRLFFDMRNRYQEGEALLRFAVDHLEASPDPDHQFQVSRIQSRRAYFLTNGRLSFPEDFRELFERSLVMARDRQDHYQMSWCLGFISWMMFYSESDTDREAESTLQECLALSVETKDSYDIADTMMGLGFLQCMAGKIHTGIQNLAEAYRLARDIGNLNIMIYTLIHWGYYAAQAELAESNFREAIAIARQIGSRRAVAFVRYHLAFLRFFAGDFDDARRIIGEALARADIHDYLETKALLLSIVSLLASVADEDYERGRQLARECYTLFEQSGALKEYNNQYRLSLAIAAISSGDDPAAREHLARAFMYSPPRWWAVVGVCLSAILLAHEGEPKRAVALLALAFNQGEHVTGWMKQWDLLAQLKTTLRHDLEGDAYCAAWEHGRALDLDTVLEEMMTASQAD
jgi:predicted ATPase/DNA-binding SARP family transcriptional activator